MALDLGQQVGPLPLGAWVAVVGAGVGFALYTRKGMGTATPVASTATDPGVGTDLTGTDAVGTGPGWVAVPPPTTAPGTATYTDNDSWGNGAIDYLIGHGYDPAISQSAIAHALQGAPMSVQEWALWAIALRALGAPPFAVDVVPPTSIPGTTTPTTPAPTPGPAPAPVSGHWFVIDGYRKTMHTLSLRFYGTTAQWRKIYDANKSGVRRATGILPYPNPTPGWITNPDPDARLTFGRILFIPS